MKKSLLMVLALVQFSATVALGKDVYVNGYTKSNGTYVAPNVRSAPDTTINNNYGTQGNYNSNTGSWGTKPQDPNQSGYTGYGSNTNTTW